MQQTRWMRNSFKFGICRVAVAVTLAMMFCESRDNDQKNSASPPDSVGLVQDSNSDSKIASSVMVTVTTITLPVPMIAGGLTLRSRLYPTFQYCDPGTVTQA